jgi:hypothetical protein
MCPTDQVVAANTLCKAKAGACDLDDFCDGSAKACPVRVLQAGIACRSANTSCDVTESCDGVNEACPADGFAPVTTVCGGDLSYTGPSTRNASTCYGVDSCPSGFALTCVKNVCAGNDRTCANCECYCFKL